MPPNITPSTFTYGSDEENDKFNANINYIVKDPNIHNIHSYYGPFPGCGAKDLTMDWTVDPGDNAYVTKYNEEKDNTDPDFEIGFNGLRANLLNSSQGLYSFRIGTEGSGYLCDVRYHYSLYAEDQLGNVTASQNRLTGTFGRTSMPQYGETLPEIVWEDGKLKAYFKVLMGRLYDDPTIGFKQLDVSYGNRTHTIDLDQEGTAFQEIGPVVSVDGGYSDRREIRFSLELDPSQVEYHKNLAFFLKGKYRNNTDSPENDKAVVLVPNAPLDQHNDFTLSFIRDGDTLEDFHVDMTSPSHNPAAVRDLYFSEGGFSLSFASDSGGFQDREGDDLFLLVKRKGVDQERIDPAGAGIFLSTTDDVEWVAVGESYQESGTPVTNYFYVNLAFTQDTELAQEPFMIDLVNDVESDRHYVTRDGTLLWRIGLDPDFTDLSGLQYLSYFEYEKVSGEVFTTEDYKQLDPANRKHRVDFPEGAASYPMPDYSFPLNPLAEGQAQWRGIGLYVQDYAGNGFVKTFDVYYDKKIPLPLDSHGGITKWFAEDDAGRENLSFYGFNRSENRLRLHLDLSSYSEEELCRIEPVSPSPYIASAVYAGEVATEGGVKTGAVDLFLQSDFPSNMPMTVNLRFTDLAGNETLNTTTVYTPAYLAGDDEKEYINPTGTEWSLETSSHYYQWTKNTVYAGDVLRLYRNQGLSYRRLNNYLDTQDILPHDSLDYELRIVNDSLYESSYAEAVIGFTRHGINNPPQLTYGETLVHRQDDGDAYFGPLTSFTLDYLDYDRDGLVLSLLVDDQEPILFPLNGSEGSFGINVHEAFPELAEDQAYRVEFVLQDSWVKNEELVQGEEPDTSGDFLFRYDSIEPDLTYSYDRRDGFTYLYGDIRLNIQEEGAGLVLRELTEAPENVSLSDAADGQEHTHLISGIPDILDCSIKLEMVDGVGNRNDWEVIGPFHKDSVDPVLTGAQIAGETGADGRMYFSRPLVPVDVAWRDNLSGAHRIAYRFREGDRVVQSGEASVAGEIANQSEGDWRILCSLAESVIENKEYSLELKVLDHAGNAHSPTWTGVSGKLVLDSTAPAVRITGEEGWSFNGGTYYYRTGQSHSLELEVQEDHPGDSLWYELTREGSVSTSSHLEGLLSSLPEGEYSLRAACRDAAGNAGYSQRFPFSVDRTVPDGDSFLFGLTEQRPFAPGEQLRFTFDGTDNASGIETLYVWIGENRNGTEIPSVSSVLPGHRADGTVPLAYVPGKNYSLNLPDTPGNYFFKIAAEDYAGNRTALNVQPGETLSIASSGESLIVQDFHVYSNHPQELKGYWRYEGEKTLNYYAYRAVAASTGLAVTDWHYSFENYGSLRYAAGLTEGEIYSFEVYAGFSDGSVSSSRFSPGAYIDLTKPEIEAVSVPAFGTLADLRVSWEASDARTSLAEVAALVETYETDGAGQILLDEVEQDGQTVSLPVRRTIGIYPLGAEETGDARGLFTSREAAELDIADGQSLLVTLLVQDLAGNMREMPAGVFVKDHSAPLVPVVIDQGDFINPDKNTVTFDWRWTKEDSHSGIASYYYQILRSGEDVKEEDWTEIAAASLSLDSTAPYENGARILMALKAVNAAGLSSVGYSNGIILDSTKPDIAAVSIQDNQGQPLSYLLGEDHWLSMHSEDEESGITLYRYEPGVFVGTEWQALEEYKEQLMTGETLKKGLPADLETLDVLYYKVTAYNATGEPSCLPGYSNGVMNYNDYPLVTSVIGESVRGGLLFSWEVEETIPLREITLDLKSSGVVTESVTLPGDARYHLFPDVDDGYYSLTIRYTAENGKSNEEPVLSRLVCVDNTGPSIGGFGYDRYVSDLFRYRFGILDNLSGGAGYRYRIGPSGSPGLLTGGWLWQDAQGEFQNRSVSFAEEFEGGMAILADGGVMIFSLQVQDRAGNWSDVIYSDPIVIDWTAPDAPTVDMIRDILVGETVYTRERCSITDGSAVAGLTLEGEDTQSGIASYSWALRKDGETNPLAWSGPVAYVPAEEDSKAISLQDIVLDGLSLDNGDTYRVYIRVENRAGLASEPGESPPLLADLSPPVFEFLTDSSGLDYKDGQVVFNGSGEMKIRLVDEAGEVLKLTYTLEDPQGFLGEEETLYFTGTLPQEMAVPFVPEDPEAFGAYRLHVSLADGGDWASELIQPARLNAPPTVTLSPVVSNPMRPFELDFSDRATDGDGISDLEVTVFTAGDPQVFHTTHGVPLSLQFDQKEPFAGTSEYVYAVKATDGYGQSSVTESTITIENTTKGFLYTDEFWTGIHYLYGKVTVPDSLTLAVDDGTHVLIQPLDEEDDPELVIAAGACLEHAGEALYELADPAMEYLWKGLSISGSADLDDITVRNARWGVTLFTDQVRLIRRSVFRDNEIGLHLFGADPLIEGCTFRDNAFYGIKEDEGSRPLVKDNLFTGNGYDYYDLDRTVLSAGELNSLEDNSGNRGDN